MNLAKAVAGRLRALDVESVISRVETTLWGLQGKALRLANVLDPPPPFDRDGYLEEDTFVEDIMRPMQDAVRQMFERQGPSMQHFVAWRDPEPLTQESVERVTAAMQDERPLPDFTVIWDRVYSNSDSMVEIHPFLEQVDSAVRQMAKAAADRREHDMRVWLGDVTQVAPDFDAEAILRGREEG